MFTPTTYVAIDGPSPPEREAVQLGTRPRESAAPLPHICFVAPDTWQVISGAKHIPVVGGAEVQQSLVAPQLAARGYRVSMVTLDHGQPDRAVVRGITCHKLYKPGAGLPVLRFLHPKLTTLWRVLKEVDADIYYQRTASYLTGCIGQFCRMHGKRSIYAAASDKDFLPGRQDIPYARDRWLFEYGLRHADRIFVQNQTQVERLRGNYGREGVIVPNTYSAPQGARADRNGYVLWVAAIRAQKRPHFVLEIARRLPHQRFVMVGGPDSGRRGEEFARDFREALAQVPNVEWKGFMPYHEADRTFDGARLVLNTSTYEGFPNIFLQGWSRGIPTVGFVDTRSRDTEGRPLYDVVEDVEQAAAAVARMMSDDAAWEEASRRVLAHYREHHSLEAVVGVYEEELGRLARRA